MAQAGRFSWFALALLSLLAGACLQPAGADRIIGPDGTQMLHVHCGNEQVECFQLASELCPRGYDLSPIFDPHDGNFLVRCKSPTQPSAIASVAPSVPAQPEQPAAARQTRQCPPEEAWPPSEVATPTEPWPAASAGASAPQPKSAGHGASFGD
jgi:hypothetical protein